MNESINKLISVCAACLADADQYFRWDCSSEQYEKSSHEYMAYLARFRSDLSELSRRMYIAYYDKIPLGRIRLEERKNVGETEIVVSIDPNFQGQKLSKPMLQTAIKLYLQEPNNKINRLVAYVKVDNLPSQKLFESIGFVEAGAEKCNQLIYAKNL